MKTKLIVLFSLLLMLITGSKIYYNAVEPNVSTTLALKQMEDPSAINSAKVRNVRNFDPFPYLYVGWTVLAGFMFWPEAKQFYEEKVSE